MAFSGIHGRKLEVVVVECSQLKDTWTGKHKPYVNLVYGTTDRRTRTSTDGGKDPTFNEKFEFSLIEGLHELGVQVCNTHSFMDSLIGLGMVNLEKVLSQGYDTALVPMESLSGRRAGGVSLTLHFPDYNVLQQQAPAKFSPYSQPSFWPLPVESSSSYPQRRQSPTLRIPTPLPLSYRMAGLEAKPGYSYDPEDFRDEPDFKTSYDVRFKRYEDGSDRMGRL